MIIVFNTCLMATPGATQASMQKLMAVMRHAIEKWHREGKPLSRQP
jgi:hypothetical protein